MNERIATIISNADPENAQYILKNPTLISMAAWYERYEKDPEKRHLADMKSEEIMEFVRKYHERYLNPANAKVGDGATVVLYTDRHAGTIIKVTPSSITVQRDEAVLDPEFKPEWIPGGFSAICLNQDEQRYTYKRDEHGEVYTFRWSEKYQSFGRPGNLRAIKGRHEYYDYNF